MNIYALFQKYFGNLVFTKIKDTNQGSVYYCRLNTHIGNAIRYIICICNTDGSIVGSERPLTELPWKVLQTRELNEFHRLKKQTYFPKQTTPFDVPINVVEKTKEYYRYQVKSSEPFNVDIILLVDEKSTYNYPDVATLSSALETFKTLVILK